MKLSLMFAASLWVVHVQCSTETADIAILILSQRNEHQQRLAADLEKRIKNQAEAIDLPLPTIHFLHKDFDHVGGWTILPILSKIADLCCNVSWMVFLEERTQINLEVLLQVLNSYDNQKEIWLGYSLYDHEPTIIHHFAFADNPKAFRYPNTISGFVFSTKLIESLATRWNERTNPSSDFSIDYAFELSTFIWNNGNGTKLTHDDRFCLREMENCATFPRVNEFRTPLQTTEIYFAVKTCRKFHKDRVQVVKGTWGTHAAIIDYFSDEEEQYKALIYVDTSIPTINLGVPNTERGHCGKTMKIIQYLGGKMRANEQLKWGLIVDDDTILSVSGLRDLLGCFDPFAPIALGERYGYNVHSKQGYNYVTGGGGIALSRAALLTLDANDVCNCPTISSPDDMFLGVCLTRIGAQIVHAPQFHQARPMDYAPEYLETHGAISFHKHWMVDAISIYKKWFADSDNGHNHNEL